MTDYRRQYRTGGTYFFTLVLADRRQHWLVSHIAALRQSVREEQLHAPFALQAWVVLPEHCHLLMRLPEGDSDFSNRLRRIKSAFSRQIPLPMSRRQSQIGKGERGVWQRRFWEHAIRDEEDWLRHMDYIHHNPLKHGLVDRVCDWPHSSFHAYVQRGVYPEDWGWAADLHMPAGE